MQTVTNRPDIAASRFRPLEMTVFKTRKSREQQKERDTYTSTSCARCETWSPSIFDSNISHPASRNETIQGGRRMWSQTNTAYDRFDLVFRIHAQISTIGRCQGATTPWMSNLDMQVCWYDLHTSKKGHSNATHKEIRQSRKQNSSCLEQITEQDAP